MQCVKSGIENPSKSEVIGRYYMAVMKKNE